MQKETATVLDLLYVTDETLTADEIAAATGLSREDVEQALMTLEEQDYVSIGIKADNANFHDVTITRFGAQAVEEQSFADNSNVQYDPVPDYWGTHGEA